jgi:hypothetical protein
VSCCRRAHTSSSACRTLCRAGRGSRSRAAAAAAPITAALTLGFLWRCWRTLLLLLLAATCDTDAPGWCQRTRELHPRDSSQRSSLALSSHLWVQPLPPPAASAPHCCCCCCSVPPAAVVGPPLLPLLLAAQPAPLPAAAAPASAAAAAPMVCPWDVSGPRLTGRPLLPHASASGLSLAQL